MPDFGYYYGDNKVKAAMEPLKLKIVVASLLFVFAVHVQCQTGDDVKNLLTDLFTTKAYNKKVRPVANQGGVMDIDIDFYLTSIIDFNEADETLKTSGYLSMFWIDEFLKWDPASFGGLDVLFLPQNDVWRPDVSLRNTYENLRDAGMGSNHLNVRVFPDGEVWWEPLEIFTSTCDVDITYYPFDVQECKLKFTAWSYRKSEVTMTLGSRGIQLNNYDENSVWDLVSAKAREEQTDETAVVFEIQLKRKPAFYLISYISPIILLTILNIGTFILPVPYGERASYAITVFLSLVVFLTIFASELPQNSDQVSLLAIYLMLMSSFSTAVVIISLIQCRLRERDRTIPVPYVNKLYRGVYTLYCCIKCRSCKRRKVVSPSKINLQEESGGVNDVVIKDVTWMNVIDAIDFLCFWFSVMFTFVSTLVLAIIAIEYSSQYEALEIQADDRFE